MRLTKHKENFVEISSVPTKPLVSAVVLCSTEILTRIRTYGSHEFVGFRVMSITAKTVAVVFPRLQKH